MIYIYTEDSNEGLNIMRMLANLYLIDADKIVKIDTINGISKLEDNIRELNINENDKVYYIYDNVVENKYVYEHILNSVRLLNKSKYKDMVKLMPIYCCEHSILSDKYAMYFANTELFPMIDEIRKYTNVQGLTYKTKANKTFKQIYNKIRKEKRSKLESLKSKCGIEYSESELEMSVTAEKLCKEIFRKSFTLDTRLEFDSSMNNCWSSACCHKKSQICSMDSKCVKQLCGIDKKLMIVCDTNFLRIWLMILEANNIKTRDIKLVDTDSIKFSKKDLLMLDGIDKENEKKISMCEETIKKKVIGSEKGIPEDILVKQLSESGFTDVVIKSAMRNILNNK